MFTGIVEAIGVVNGMDQEGANVSYWLSSPISDELKIDQSVSHDGVCLTVDATQPGRHRVTAVAETLAKTNLRKWIEGVPVNLERSMLMNGRLDGHIVQGHVDTTATVISVSDESGSWKLRIRFNRSFAPLVIEKGSICLNGTSLTVFDCTLEEFSVAIIPYTYEHTNLKMLKAGDLVNLEFDIIGKYINRITTVSLPQ